MKLFYATDVHGSDRCFTKFVNAASFYGADAILLGGDLTGKAIVPLVRENGVHRGVFLGEDVAAEGDAVGELEKKIANAGYYSHRCDPDEEEALRADPTAREALFLRLMRERLERWVALAEERLRPQDVPCYMNAGNDDPAGIDAVLESSEWVQFLEGRTVDPAGRHRGGELRLRKPHAVELPARRRGGRARTTARGRRSRGSTTRRGPSSTSTARRTTPASTPDRSWTRISG